MKAALFGKGILGRRAYEYITSSDGVELVVICKDILGAGNGSSLVLSDLPDAADETAVVGLKELSDLYSRGAVDAVVLATDNELADFCVRRLKESGITDIAFLPSYYEEVYEVEDESFVWIETDKPRLPYLEYHISFHCNLKCAGCTHFSNIISGERFGDLDHFCNDLMRLQELFWGIGKIRLMGGEPLLNPELPEFIYASRAAFPDADIRVVSNGLMLRGDMIQVLDAMRVTATYFDVSMYPPTASSIERIASICSSHGVKLTVTPDISDFTAGMNTHGCSDPVTTHRACPASHCAYLCDGLISTCAMPQLIDIYNEKYGLDISGSDSDVTDIYEEDLDGYALLDRLKSPMDICRYCDERRRPYKWFVSTEPEAAEWIGVNS